MTDRDRLIELLKVAETKVTEVLSTPLALEEWLGIYADYLLANGVILPPCKVGDIVYTTPNYVWSDECCDCEYFRVGGFGDPNECARTEDGNKHPDCIKIKEEVITQHDILFNLCFDKFGKTVFLTKEEAEKALKERVTI